MGNYVVVNGLKIYYELHGAGEPLVLLHGGVGGIEMFGPNLPALSATRQVIAVDLQGHGHTADIDRPLRFELMADDIAALIKQLKIERADIMGYSLGGGVALQTAIREPEVVRKLVLVSTPFKRQGFYPEVLASFDQMGPEAAKYMSQSPLSQLYPEVDWATLFTKLGDLLRQEYDWSKEVAAITSPVMIAFADANSSVWSTSWSSSHCLAAVSRMPGWMGPGGRWRGSPSCRARRTTTSSPPRRWRPSLLHSSMPLCNRPGGIMSWKRRDR